MNRKGILRVQILLFLYLIIFGLAAKAEPGTDYQLGAGDIVHVLIFQNPDLSLDVRVSESGVVSFPLIGRVKLGGLTIDEAEQRITNLLKDGGFVQQPQVNISIKQNNGNLVSVLGQVGRPGRYPLETFNMKVTDILASAGGISPSSTDVIILVGEREGKPFRKEIDIPAIYIENRQSENILIKGGDQIYVHRAPMFYIYGEVQRPGSSRIEKNMTVMQALAQSGGPTMRGTQRGLRIYRRGKDNQTEIIKPELTDLIQLDDVLYVRESLF
jgi:polysaccharide export outer membrane protein